MIQLFQIDYMKGTVKKMENNVVLVTFKNQLSAYEVLSEIRRSYSGKDYFISEAAVIKKENGEIKFKEGFEVSSKGTLGFLSGGLIGSFIGILGGPLGIIFGGSLGALIGTGEGIDADIAGKGILFDTDKYLTDDNFGLVLLSTEENNSSLDEFLNKFGADIILKKDAVVVLKELELAREYENQLKKEVRKDEFKKVFNEKKEELKTEIDKFNDKVKSSSENFSNKLNTKLEEIKKNFKK